jgi:predicted phosphodiesterase
MPIRLPPISRRSFLASTLAAGTHALVPQALWAKEAVTDPNCFALLSDIHIPTKQDTKLHGVAPVETLTQTIERILKESTRPAGAIVTGDCAFLEGKADDYHMIKKTFGSLQAGGVPIHLALGNHDGRKQAEEAFPELRAKTEKKLELQKFITIIETPHANWFLLDSLEKTNSTPGLLGEMQLTWLAKELDARAGKPALLMAHHNLDTKANTHGLTDTKAFFDVILPRKQVKAYFYGHTHAWHIQKHGDLHLVNIPTTAWLFDQKQPRGFVSAHLHASGATLVLHSLDKKHPKHGEKIELLWRT